ncbi:DUF3850 domain-containing protein [Enterobacter cloacae]
MSTITKEPVTHNLKIWPEYFAAVRDGLKRAELRWNDREYQAGDILDLCEWDPNEEAFTGDLISVTVTHVAELGQWVPGYVLLSVAPPAPVEDTEIQRKASTHDAICEKYNVDSLSDFVDWQRNHIAELEAAPPAPVGDGETAVMPDFSGYALTQRECYQAGKKAGLAEAGNYPVAHDGWVACSERMPDPDSKFRICAYTPTSHEDVRFRFVPASLFKSVCRDATHWQYMLPPAAPLQGV